MLTNNTLLKGLGLGLSICTTHTMAPTPIRKVFVVDTKLAKKRQQWRNMTLKLGQTTSYVALTCFWRRVIKEQKEIETMRLAKLRSDNKRKKKDQKLQKERVKMERVVLPTVKLLFKKPLVKKLDAQLEVKTKLRVRKIAPTKRCKPTKNAVEAVRKKKVVKAVKAVKAVGCKKV